MVYHKCNWLIDDNILLTFHNIQWIRLILDVTFSPHDIYLPIIFRFPFSNVSCNHEHLVFVLKSIFSSSISSFSLYYDLNLLNDRCSSSAKNPNSFHTKVVIWKNHSPNIFDTKYLPYPQKLTGHVPFSTTLLFFMKPSL